MRLTKSDPTGSYSYLNDGFSPASDVLTDGYSTFPPGLSEMNALGTRFYLADASGNSRGLLNGSGSATDGYNWDAFGNLMSRFGSNPTMFAWNEASGYQSDSDDGLTLLGHRYYDKRTGRFISQDPTHFGRNWYAYADNSPTSEVDPSGLRGALIGNLNLPGDWSEQQIEDYVALNYDDGTYSVNKNGQVTSFTVNTLQTVGGLPMNVPPGQDFNSMVAAARSFANNINAKEAALATHGPTGLLKATLTASLEAEKAKWYVDHFGKGTIGDPKHWNIKYENFGNFQAGAAADVMGYSLGPYLLGAQGAHMVLHPFGPLGLFEDLTYTEAGYGYAQARYGN